MEEGPVTKKSGGRCGWIRGPQKYIYMGHFLSSWGDRMWGFALGLYLVYLGQKSLRLAAVYGFSACGAVLLFGGLIGDWVDRNQRLMVVRIVLFIQNFAVALCAVTVLLRLQYEDVIPGMLNGHLPGIMEALVIVLGIIARLASVGSKIAIEKDWIVVVAGKDKTKLADLNAATRAIDLLCKIMSPLAVGQVMSYANLKIGAAVIAGWNLVSVFVEYSLLHRVHNLVPALAVKNTESEEEASEIELENMKEEEKKMLDKTEDPKQIDTENDETKPAETEEQTRLQAENGSTAEPSGGETANKKSSKKKKEEEKKTKGMLMVERLLMIFKGWPIYMRQDCVYAGLALSGLFMTVLGFDSVTVGYAYALGLSESILGISYGLAGFTGIIATFVYPRLRAKIGLERTGLFAFSGDVLLLSLCVISIWMPGSPSILFKDRIPIYTKPENCSDSVFNNTLSHSYDHSVHLPSTELPLLINVSNVVFQNGNISEGALVAMELNDTTVMPCPPKLPRPLISVILFLTGIVGSRVGLWLADLTITQIMQETIPEQKRGIVNGVQSSLNMLLDMFKFVMVIAAPQPRTFSILILISFVFIILSGMLFSYHSWRVRGHLFHFDKITKPCNGHAGNTETEMEDRNIAKAEVA